jgi:hypothetical protein
MAYGFVAYDALGRKVVDSDWPVFAFERKVTLTGTALTNSTGNIYGYHAYDVNNPTAFLGPFTQFPFTPNIARYRYNTTSVLSGDATASSAILAFKIPIGGFAYYDDGYNNAYGSHTMPSIEVAVLKPISVLANVTSGYGGLVYNSSGVATWSAAYPIVRIQGKSGNISIVESSWFILNGNRRYGLTSTNFGKRGNIGILRTSATTIQTKYFAFFGAISPFSNYGADTQDTAGLVLYDILV